MQVGIGKIRMDLKKRNGHKKIGKKSEKKNWKKNEKKNREKIREKKTAKKNWDEKIPQQKKKISPKFFFSAFNS